jgi:hypothetical protein
MPHLTAPGRAPDCLTARTVDGTLYIAGYLNHAVRKVDRSGTVTTIAGGNGVGFEGDGGPATPARLCRPYAVARGPGCSLYISDIHVDHDKALLRAGFLPLAFRIQDSPS